MGREGGMRGWVSATLSLTSPTNTIQDTSLAFFLSLWIKAKSTFSLSAIDVTLNGGGGGVKYSNGVKHVGVQCWVIDVTLHGGGVKLVVTHRGMVLGSAGELYSH